MGFATDSAGMVFVWCLLMRINTSGVALCLFDLVVVMQVASCRQCSLTLVGADVWIY